MTLWMDGLHLLSVFKCFTILPDIYPFMHTFTHQVKWSQVNHARRQPACREPAVRVRCLAQVHQHSARRSRGSNQQPSSYQPTRSNSWASATHIEHRTSVSLPDAVPCGLSWQWGSAVTVSGSDQERIWNPGTSSTQHMWYCGDQGEPSAW